jgi:hypothetical protein
MSMPGPSHAHAPSSRAQLRLSLAACAGPTLWLCLLVLLYALGDRRCELGLAPLAWAWGLLSVFTLAPGLFLLAQRKRRDQAAPVVTPRPQDGLHFLVALGLLLHLISLLLCLGLVLPLFFLRPCQ